VTAVEGGDAGATIVCGVDDDALDAVAHAVELSRLLGARLVVAHVVRSPVPSLGVGPTPRQLEETPVDALNAAGNALVERVLQEAEVAGVDRRIVFGSPAARLTDIADEEAADLIVVGSRRRAAFTAALLGSVSVELILTARCPVLVVPNESEEVAIERRSRSAGSVRNAVVDFDRVHAGGRWSKRLRAPVLAPHSTSKGT
jgi:nucleotide-binding universal stress UspA family protein